MTTRIVCISDTHSLECDLTERGERTGCADLLEAERRIRPSLHVSGPIQQPPVAAGLPTQKST